MRETILRNPRKMCRQACHSTGRNQLEGSQAGCPVNIETLLWFCIIQNTVVISSEYFILQTAPIPHGNIAIGGLNAFVIRVLNICQESHSDAFIFVCVETQLNQLIVNYTNIGASSNVDSLLSTAVKPCRRAPSAENLCGASGSPKKWAVTRLPHLRLLQKSGSSFSSGDFSSQQNFFIVEYETLDIQKRGNPTYSHTKQLWKFCPIFALKRNVGCADWICANVSVSNWRLNRSNWGKGETLETQESQFAN